MPRGDLRRCGGLQKKIQRSGLPKQERGGWATCGLGGGWVIVSLLFVFWFSIQGTELPVDELEERYKEEEGG